MIKKVSWTEFKEISKKGVYFCFYSNHHQKTDEIYCQYMNLILKKYDKISSIDIDWQDCKNHNNLKDKQKLDIFLYMNGIEIIRCHNPKYKDIIQVLEKAKSVEMSKNRNKTIHKSQIQPESKVNKTSMKQGPFTRHAGYFKQKYGEFYNQKKVNGLSDVSISSKKDHDYLREGISRAESKIFTTPEKMPIMTYLLTTENSENKLLDWNPYQKLKKSHFEQKCRISNANLPVDMSIIRKKSRKNKNQRKLPRSGLSKS